MHFPDRQVNKLVGVITPIIAVKRHKREERVYMAEYRNRRVNGKVKSEFIRYLGVERDKEIAKPPVKTLDKVPLQVPEEQVRCIFSGDSTEDLEIPDIIERMCRPVSSISSGKVLKALAIDRVMDPESATQLES